MARDRIYNKVETKPRIPKPLAPEKTPHNNMIIKFWVSGMGKPIKLASADGKVVG